MLWICKENYEWAEICLFMEFVWVWSGYRSDTINVIIYGRKTLRWCRIITFRNNESINLLPRASQVRHSKMWFMAAGCRTDCVSIDLFPIFVRFLCGIFPLSLGCYRKLMIWILCINYEWNCNYSQPCDTSINICNFGFCEVTQTNSFLMCVAARLIPDRIWSHFIAFSIYGIVYMETCATLPDGQNGNSMKYGKYRGTRERWT